MRGRVRRGVGGARVDTELTAGSERRRGAEGSRAHALFFRIELRLCRCLAAAAGRCSFASCEDGRHCWIWLVRWIDGCGGCTVPAGCCGAFGYQNVRVHRQHRLANLVGRRINAYPFWTRRWSKRRGWLGLGGIDCSGRSSLDLLLAPSC